MSRCLGGLKGTRKGPQDKSLGTVTAARTKATRRARNEKFSGNCYTSSFQGSICLPSSLSFCDAVRVCLTVTRRGAWCEMYG